MDNTPTPNVKQSLISVDAVALRLSGKQLQVLLVKRWNDPYAGMLALPGVLLNTNESIEEAVQRALFDKGDIDPSEYRGLEQLGVFDGTNRDPRGATISVSCFAFLSPECSTSGTWVNVEELPELPFDHALILQRALHRLSSPSEELTWGVLGEEFTTGQYASMLISLGETVDRSNLSRIIPARLSVEKLAATKNGRKQSVWSLARWRRNNPLG